jgi:hypothetical protein
VALRPGNQVWVVRDDRLYTVDVKVAQAAGNRLLLFAGLSDLASNDKLVVSPLAMAIDGMQVRTQATTRTVSELSSAKPMADGGIPGSSATPATQELSR